MADYAYISFSFLTAFLNVVPFLWQFNHSNPGPASLTFWAVITNLSNGIGASIWANDAAYRLPVWCDIAAKISLAAPIGFLCSGICIAKFLAQVVSPGMNLSIGGRSGSKPFYDYLFCFGFPLFVMATHIVYQPNRFGISKTIGCMATVVNSWPAYALYFIWQPLLAAAGSFLAMYVVVRLIRYRRQFGKLVAQSSSALTTSRLLRLGALASIYFAFTLPITIYSFGIVQNGAGPYLAYSWSGIHGQFSSHFAFPQYHRTEFYNWLSIVQGLLIVAFFGFSTESLNYYASAAKLLGFRYLFNKFRLAHRLSIVADPSARFHHHDYNEMQDFTRTMSDTAQFRINMARSGSADKTYEKRIVSIQREEYIV